MTLSSRALSLLILPALVLCILCPAGASLPDGTQNLTAVSTHGAAVQPSDPAEVGAFLDRIMPANLARYNVPGATVAVVKNSRLVTARGYGFSDIANRTPVNATTTSFRIGSITKLFTWTAVMQLADEGKIDLDADVNTYLKDFRIPDTYPGHPVTLRHLMTHTAGFEDQARHMMVDDVRDLPSYRQYCAENIPARVFPPGKVSSYSNYGTTLAAVIVEDVSGMPFDQYLQSRILTPLAMNRTSIQEDLPPDLAPGLSGGFTYANGENIAARDWIVTVGPAGSISSPAPDMAKFMIAHLQNGTYGNATILSQKAAALMHARAFENDPRVAGMCLGIYEQYYNNRRLIGHSGDTGEFHSLLVLLPEEQSGLFVSYNSAGGSHARNELFTEFMNHYYPAGETPHPGPANLTTLQQYAGSYEMNRHNYARFEKFLSPVTPTVVTVSSQGTLLVDSGTGPAEYAEIRPGVFAKSSGTPPALGKIVFHAVPDGSIDFLCYENYPFFVYDRIPFYATPGFQHDLRLGAGYLLATVLLWPLLFAFRRTRGIPEPSDPVPARIARWIAGAAALLLVLFIFVLLPTLTSDSGLMFAYINSQTVPAVLLAVQTVPVCAAVLTVPAVILAVLAWKGRYWSVPHRIHYTIIALALIAMLWLVNFWNLWVWCL